MRWTQAISSNTGRTLAKLKEVAMEKVIWRKIRYEVIIGSITSSKPSLFGIFLSLVDEDSDYL